MPTHAARTGCHSLLLVKNLFAETGDQPKYEPVPKPSMGPSSATACLCGILLIRTRQHGECGAWPPPLFRPIFIAVYLHLLFFFYTNPALCQFQRPSLDVRPAALDDTTHFSPSSSHSHSHLRKWMHKLQAGKARFCCLEITEETLSSQG